MKILHVISYFSPHYGGTVASTYLTCRKLADRGHEVTILTTDMEFDMKFAQNLKGVQVIPIKSLLNIGLFIYSPQIKQWLSHNLSTFDIIHMHDLRSYQHAMVVKFARQFKVPCILQARGSVLPFFEKIILKYCFDFVWGQKILDYAHKVIALTEVEASQYKVMKVPEDKIVIIPNGIDLTNYRFLPDKGTFKEKNKIPRENKIVLYLGRIHKIKGIDLLLEAYYNLQKAMEKVSLVIVGPDGGCQNELETRAKELGISNNVVFTGPLYDQDKLSAYIDADVYVLPSEHEAFSNTVLEAWACSTPVIITDSCALSPAITKEQAGIVVKRDPIELSDAIQRVLEEDELRDMITARGQGLVVGEYNIENVIGQVMECYQKSIASGERRQ